MKVLKWVLSICFFHSLMLLIIIIAFFMPFMIYSDIKQVLINEVPGNNANFFIVALVAFFIYLAMRNRFLGIPYRKITILLPLMQMSVYISIALSAALVFVNKWADSGVPAKEWAIIFAVIAFVIVRLCMSLLYWKYPIVKPQDKLINKES